MKINYAITNKKYRHYFNLAMGIFAERRKIKKNRLRRIHSYSQIIIKNYLLCILLIPFIGFFENVDQLAFFEMVLVFLFLLLLFMNTISLFLSVVCYFKVSQNVKSGEVRMDEFMIMDTRENGKEISKSWEKMDFIYVMEKVIFIFSKKRIVFFLPVEIQEQLPVLDYLKEIQKKYPSIQIIDTVHEYYPKESIFKKHFLNWGVYLLFIFFGFSFAVGCEIYNLAILEKEMQRISDSDFEVEDTIYSFGKYAVVEKELKNFFLEFGSAYQIYSENSAMGATYFLSANYLEEHKENLKDLLKEFPSMEIKAEKALKKVLKLLEEEQIKERILKWDLEDFYNDLFYEYTLDYFSDVDKKEWQFESYNNHLRMQYLTRMIEILTLPDACWFIEEDSLYFCDDAQLQEYNELYDLLMENQNKTDSVTL